MAVMSVSKNPAASNADKIFNPDSQLDKDAFMKLFLTQLKLQDPTDPMDTDKMLEQTAYLSTMEMNNNMQKTLDNLSNVLSATSQFSTLSSIGKMADTGNRYVNITDEDKNVNFDLYFGKNITSGNVIIKDKNGNIVKTFPLEAHTKGVLNFEWDLIGNNGKRVPSDSYEVTAEYTTPDGKTLSTALGAYPIESVRFENGKPFAKLGSNYLPFNEIQEIYQWQD